MTAPEAHARSAPRLRFLLPLRSVRVPDSTSLQSCARSPSYGNHVPAARPHLPANLLLQFHPARTLRGKFPVCASVRPARFPQSPAESRCAHASRQHTLLLHGAALFPHMRPEFPDVSSSARESGYHVVRECRSKALPARASGGSAQSPR